MDGEFGDEEPVGHALAVPPELDALDAGCFALEELVVVIHIGLGHAAGIEVEVGHAEDFGFVVHGIALAEAQAGEHEVALAVFGEEMDAGDVVEEPMEVRFGSEGAEPAVALLLPAADDGGWPLPEGAGLQECRISHHLCRDDDGQVCVKLQCRNPP